MSVIKLLPKDERQRMIDYIHWRDRYWTITMLENLSDLKLYDLYKEVEALELEEILARRERKKHAKMS